MKIAVSGKGGAGKTTISGTIARALAQSGHDVMAIDADVNPMLGISLGLGMDGTERLAGLRQQVSESGNANDAIHQYTIEGLIERFGEDAPDGVRIVVASRVDMPDHGCLCCGVSADRLLREMEGGGRTVVGDLEAGIGVLSRMKKGSLDAVLVVANPTPKSIEVARRAAEAAVALARGEKVQTSAAINNGRTDVPSILLEPVVVDKANIDDTVVKDGYQKREAIYQNAPAGAK